MGVASDDAGCISSDVDSDVIANDSGPNTPNRLLATLDGDTDQGDVVDLAGRGYRSHGSKEGVEGWGDGDEGHVGKSFW